MLYIFEYDYITQKWGKKRALYLYRSVIPLSYTDDVYKDISNDFEKCLNTSNYDETRRKIPLSFGNKQKNNFLYEI